MHSTSSARSAEAVPRSTLVDHFYRIDPSMDPREVFERLSDVLRHLSAQLTIITGEGHETFSCYNQELQHQFLFGCYRQASEAVDLLKVVGPAVYRATH